MAWNPTPEVAVVRDAARKLGADRAVVFYTRPDGRIGYASYGETKELCAQARALAEVVWKVLDEHFAAAHAEDGGQGRRPDETDRPLGQAL